MMLRLISTFSSLHVKENFSQVKASLPSGTPHKEVMKMLSLSFKDKCNVGDPGST